MIDKAALEILEVGRNAGYGPRPIPVRHDEEITELLRSSKLSDLVGLVTRDHFEVLRCYAERMASQAARSKDPATLQLGLAALGLADLGGSRNALTVLPLFYHAAMTIGVVPGRLFRTVAAMLGGEAGSVLESFPDRSEEDRSLEAMGYRVGQDAGGFRYERTWLPFRPCEPEHDTEPRVLRRFHPDSATERDEAEGA